MRHKDLQSWLDWQLALHPSEIDLGLDRIREVAERLNLTQPSATVITVAGTNGKGSSVAFLSSILQQAGYSVGVYTSPHFIHYNERFEISGQQASDEKIMQAFDAIDVARADISLTYFEWATLAALWLFADAQVDIWVLEVGLGGRLDAVNIIDADCALITAIDVDHVDWLGDDREVIGREKAGILRTSQVAVCSDLNPPESIQCVANELGTDFFQLSTIDLIDESVQLGLLGEFQRVNASGVVRMLERSALEVPAVAMEQGLKQARITGRMQWCEVQGRKVCLDIAHNAQSVKALADYFDMSEVKPSIAVFGQMDDKVMSDELCGLTEFVERWLVPQLEGERARPALKVAAELEDLGARFVSVFDTIGLALQQAVQQSSEGDVVIVFGSFSVVGPALEWIEHGHQR